MPTGWTKDVGWQLGVRRTVAADAATVWEYLLGEGLSVWLGETALGEKGGWYETADGVRGQIRSRTEKVRIRLTWQLPEWSHDSTLQVSLMPAATGTAVGFHQERLATPKEREELLAHWRKVADTLVQRFR